MSCSEACQSSEGTQTDEWVDPLDNDEDDDVGYVSSQHHMSVMERIASTIFVQDRRHCSTQTAKDPLCTETENLAFDVVYYTLGRRSESSAKDEVTKCLRKSVDRMLEKHAMLFNGMVNRLKIQRNSDLKQGFREMSDELFRQEVSWSKIIALFAFGARLAQYCHNQNMAAHVINVASYLSQTAVEKITPFVRQHGGWVTLCDAFPLESDYETTIWKSLVVTGLGLSLVATFLALQH